MLNRIQWLSAMTLVAALGLTGCTDAGDGALTTATGQATYKDAETASDGSPRPATPPLEQETEVTIRLAGSGTLRGLEAPECTADGAAGQFRGLYSGTGEIRDDGTYVASFVEGDASFTTPTASCEIPEVSIEALSEVVLVAKLENTTSNCESYCEAKARSVAESECGATATAASCRAEVQAEYVASCATRCTGSTTRRITAELVISATSNASLLADLNARQLGATGLGSIEADLRFEQIREDHGDGELVPEAP